MKINILHLLEGARAARGVTVIIDVFRAFSVEAYLFSRGAERIIPTDSIESAMRLKEKYPDALLCGERGGAKIEGFDFGNSPSQLKDADVSGRVIIHTTSAGTQGIANASGADEILGGSLVCARAISTYIHAKNPDTVSLVCMGLAAERDTDEDILCAEYIKSLLEGNPLTDMDERIERLKETDGKKFFAPENSEVFPREDFDMCVRLNALPFALRLTEDADGTKYMERVDTEHLITMSGSIPPEGLPKIERGDRISKFTKEEIYSFTKEMQASLAYSDIPPLPERIDYTLVLGGESHFMPSRAKAAAELYHRGICRLFFTSGGVLRDTAHGMLTEAAALKAEMISLGVPSELIIEEKAATTTIENMTLSERMAKDMLGEGRKSVAIATSRFHLRRSLLLAKSFIKDADIYGAAGEYPEDNPEEFKNSPTVSECIKKECRLLYRFAGEGLIEDFVILD